MIYIYIMYVTHSLRTNAVLNVPTIERIRDFGNDIGSKSFY